MAITTKIRQILTEWENEHLGDNRWRTDPPGKEGVWRRALNKNVFFPSDGSAPTYLPKKGMEKAGLEFEKGKGFQKKSPKKPVSLAKIEDPAEIKMLRKTLRSLAKENGARISVKSGKGSMAAYVMVQGEPIKDGDKRANKAILKWLIDNGYQSPSYLGSLESKLAQAQEQNFARINANIMKVSDGTPAKAVVKPAEPKIDKRKAKVAELKKKQAQLKDIQKHIDKATSAEEIAALSKEVDALVGKPKAKLTPQSPKEAKKSEPLTAQQRKKRASVMNKRAAALDKHIESLEAPREENTSRRAQQAIQMRRRASRLKRDQGTLRALASAHEADQPLSSTLQNIASLSDVEAIRNTHAPNFDRYTNTISVKPADLKTLDNLLRNKKGLKGLRSSLANMGRRVEGSAIVPHRYLDRAPMLRKLKSTTSSKWDKMAFDDILDQMKTVARFQRLGISNAKDLKAAQAELETFTPKESAAAQKKDTLKQKETALRARNIPGFFPTPDPVISKMMDAVDIQPHHKVLEPSAGKGDIADHAAKTGADVTTLERDQRLKEILKLKGHKVSDDSDFMQHEGSYDRIVMNPPFEKGQDMDHVQHAYDLLKPGGKMVAIMSEGPFFRGRSKDKKFRDWLDKVGGDAEKLAPGSFKSSFNPTNVSTRMVVIEK